MCVEGITVNVQHYTIGLAVQPHLQYFILCAVSPLHTISALAEMRMIMYAVKAQLDTLNISSYVLLALPLNATHPSLGWKRVHIGVIFMVYRFRLWFPSCIRIYDKR